MKDERAPMLTTGVVSARGQSGSCGVRLLMFMREVALSLDGGGWGGGAKREEELLYAP